MSERSFCSFERGTGYIVPCWSLTPELNWSPEWLGPQAHTILRLSFRRLHTILLEGTGHTSLTSSADEHFAGPICRLLGLTCFGYTSTKVCSSFCFQFFQAHVYGGIKPFFIFPTCLCVWCSCKSIAWVHIPMWHVCVEARGWNWLSSSITFHLIYWTQSASIWLDQLASLFQRSLVFAAPELWCRQIAMTR